MGHGPDWWLVESLTFGHPIFVGTVGVTCEPWSVANEKKPKVELEFLGSRNELKKITTKWAQQQRKVAEIVEGSSRP